MNIFIDTQAIYNTYALSKEQIEDLLDYTAKEVTAGFAREWQNEANTTLKSSRQEYVNGIVVVDEGFAQGAVVLTGSFPNMIESGAETFDIKDGVLNGPNAKTGKDGKKYNTIPFKFGIPTSLAENFNGGILPEEVHSILKERNANEPLEKYDLKNLPAQLKEPQKKQVRMPESKSFAEYQHKHSIYEGVSKKKDETTGQNSYVSFRRVSENSDPASFIHPGIEAHNLAEKTLDSFQIDRIVSTALDNWLSTNL